MPNGLTKISGASGIAHPREPIFHLWRPEPRNPGERGDEKRSVSPSAEREDDRVGAHPALAVRRVGDLDLQLFALGEEDLADEVAEADGRHRVRLQGDRLAAEDR